MPAMSVAARVTGCRCLECNYLLDGLDDTRCAECGRTFDPADPASVRQPGAAGTREIILRTARLSMLSTPVLSVALILSSWLSLAFGPLAIIPLIAIVICALNGRWKAAVIAFALSPIFVSFVRGTIGYASGTAAIWGEGLPGTAYGNVDPQFRCGHATSGCLVSGSEWMTHAPNNAAIVLLTRILGPQPGAYTGPYPTDRQASAAVTSGEVVQPAAVLADLVTLRSGRVKLAPGVGKRLLDNNSLGGSFDTSKPTAAIAAFPAENGPITGTLWQQRCLILRFPADAIPPAGSTNIQRACVVCIDTATGYPFAYYGEGDYHHRIPPVEWRN
jgi:hypothetical protein